MATQLVIVNDILRRLREDEVTDVAANSYSKLLGQFVNDAMNELEDMWFWTVNETSIDTTILADGTLTYDLTGTSDRSFLVRQEESRLPMAFDITDDAEGQLCDVPLKELNRWRDTYRGTPETSTRPTGFAIVPDADGRGYTLSLLHGSSTARTWRTYWYAPQTELAIDGTDNDTEILLPKRPVYLRALYYALMERGEEIGTPLATMRVAVRDATAAAMELDLQVNKKDREIDVTNLEALRNGIVGDW